MQIHRIATRSFTTLAAAIGLLAALPALAGAAPTLTAVTPAQVVVGETVVVSGTVVPAALGEQVRVEQRINGVWTQLGPVGTTSATGEWQVTARPMQSGAVRATQVTGTGGISTEGALAVSPKVLTRTLLRGPVYPFLGTKATYRIAPVEYAGKVRAELSIDGRAAGFVSGTAAKGKVALNIPTNGTGRYAVRLLLPETSAFAAANDMGLGFVVRGQRVGPGASSMWVKSLRAGLNFRGIYTTRSGGYDSRMGESVIAFHKAYGRPRTTSFEASDWLRLSRNRIKPAKGGAGLHIEIDKSRQLLMQVKDGKVVMAVHVSTGATGNTPVGTHKIQWKGNWVPSLYGSLLYKSMAFQGAFAIHGYPSVPTTAASHGCVRVPMWIAAKLYARSPVNTPVYVYAGPGSTTPSVGRTERAPGTEVDLPELTGVDPAVWADETA